VDLTPRVPTAATSTKRRRPWPAIAVLALVLVAGGVAVTKFLTSAIDYYCNVDEVGTKDGCEAGRRLRIQGTVEEGTVVNDGAVTTFTITFNGVSIPVRYDGEPGGLFQECIPVVVHGELRAGDDANDAVAAAGSPIAAGAVFHGDRLEVKHGDEYEAENEARLDQARSAACSQRA